MRKGFAKRFAAVLLALCVAAALPLASAFADSNGKDSYIVVFTSGDQGHFYYENADAVMDALQIEAADGYEVALKQNSEGETTSIAVRVPAGESLNLLGVNSIVANDRYQVSNIGANIGQNTDSGLGEYNAAQITRDYMLVPAYQMISDTEEKYSYTVQFLQQGTDVEVAPTQYGEFYGSANSVTVNALAVNDFTLVGASTAVVDKDNLAVVFEYTQNVHVNTVTEYVDGDVIVNYNDVNLVGGAGVVGGGGAGEGEGEGGEVIEEDETPQAGGDQTEPGSETEPGGEDIEEDETPQAGVDEAATGISMPMVVGGVAILLLIALIVILALRKRRSGEGEE